MHETETGVFFRTLVDYLQEKDAGTSDGETSPVVRTSTIAMSLTVLPTQMPATVQSRT